MSKYIDKTECFSMTLKDTLVLKGIKLLAESSLVTELNPKKFFLSSLTLFGSL